MFHDQLISEILAIYGSRYRYVQNSWWRYDTDTKHWDKISAHQKLYFLIHNMWDDQLRQDERARRAGAERKVPEIRDYLIRRMMSRLSVDLWAVSLPGRPEFIPHPSSAPPAPPPEPEPAP